MDKLVKYFMVLLLGVALGYAWNMTQWERAEKEYLQYLKHQEDRIEKLVLALGSMEGLKATVKVAKKGGKK